ncbi:unnamed protein product [Closterium sp. Naga37s-1]|nr:unnamed protein product [Closterium sp. Naga37s-1]
MPTCSLQRIFDTVDSFGSFIWALPVADFPQSVKCETGCGAGNVDCGVEAKCMIKESKGECVCAGALVFDATAKQCRAPPPSCATIVCPTNSTCNATADPPCICNAGFEMTNGQCVGKLPPSHPLAQLLFLLSSFPHFSFSPSSFSPSSLSLLLLTLLSLTLLPLPLASHPLASHACFLCTFLAFSLLCAAPPPSCATIVCPTNSTCNATADPPCICNEGLTMTDGQCLGEPPPSQPLVLYLLPPLPLPSIPLPSPPHPTLLFSHPLTSHTCFSRPLLVPALFSAALPPSCATIVCPTNSTCNATADPPCICNEGLTMADGQCLGEPPPSHPPPSLSAPSFSAPTSISPASFSPALRLHFCL